MTSSFVIIIAIIIQHSFARYRDDRENKCNSHRAILV